MKTQIASVRYRNAGHRQTLDSDKGGMPLRDINEPAERNSLPQKRCLKRAARLQVGIDSAGRHSCTQAIGRQQSRQLSYVPLKWLHPVSAVGKVRGSQVFAGGQQIVEANRDQSA